MELSIDGMLHLRDAAPELVHLIKQENLFRNPKREAIQQYSKRPESADKLPEKIPIYYENREGIHIPRGYAKLLFHRHPEYYPKMLDHRTTAPAEIPALSGIELRGYQQRALDVIGIKDQGIIEAPTGAGKTIIGLSLMHLRGERSMVLVHNKGLLNQWREVIRERLGLEPGIIGDQQFEEGVEITVAMIQTLSRRLSNLKALGGQYGLLMVDEAHHVPAATFGMVVNHLHCKYRYGLTATPHRRDGQHEMIRRYVGEVLIKILPDEVESVGGTVPVAVEVVHAPGAYYGVEDWNGFIKAIVESATRHQLIIDIAEAASQTHPTLILVDRIAHVKMLGELSPGAVLMHGKLNAKDRKTGMAAIQEADLTIGTFNMLGEGLDISRWGVLVLASPASGRVRVLQAIGRVLRPAPGKKKAQVFDILDYSNFAYGSYERRLKIYGERGYELTFNTKHSQHNYDDDWDR